jgi:predicted transcriptional regulator
MKSYLDSLKQIAEAHNVPLLRAFQAAGLPTSTYYRTINGATELRYDTADKVRKSIDELYKIQQDNQYS